MKCGDDSHDYAYLTAPPEIDSPDTSTFGCATECPLADGREYKSKGEVSDRRWISLGRLGSFSNTNLYLAFPHGLRETSRNKGHL